MIRRRNEVISPPPPLPPAAPPSPALTLSPAPSLRTVAKKMSEPLDNDELAVFFSGAPQFSLVHLDDEEDDDDEFALQPKVTFPFGGGSDEEADLRPPGHAAFALCMAAEEEAMVVREVPPMASFVGWEPGTVGWEYFLMLPAGDADRDQEQDEFEGNLDEGGRERGGGVRERERGSVRSVEVGYIVERLKELGAIWQAKKRKRRAQQMGRAVFEEESEDDDEKGGIPTSVEMYTHLFTHLLYPPTRIATEDYADPYSLKVQIMALIHALGKKVWLDFSIVRWRIKLGQILWGDIATTAAMEDDQDGEEYEEWEATTKESERVWLLLQILLACELLVRMDTVLSDEEDRNRRRASVRSNQPPPESKEQMLQRFRHEGGRKVQWDIVLARRWLDNIRIEMDALSPKASPVEKETEKLSFLAPPSRWFGIAQTPPSPEHSDPSTPDLSEVADALLLPRQPRRQVEGLLHFARKLHWPNLDSLAQQVISRAPAPGTPSSASALGTPLACGTPLSTAASSYFPSPMPRPKRLREITSEVAPTLHRQKSANLTVPSVSGCGGWLSRSYLTGLVLPGEGLNHLIISTLLENDPAAVEVLGFNANLYGGFQYLGKTWWSRYCIVGRVMAGFDGAGEESGWVGPVKGSGVSIEGGDEDVVVGNIPDGWIDVLTQPSPDSKSPRALEAKSVERDCDIRGRGWKRGTKPKEDAFVTVDIGAAAADADLDVQIRGLYFNPVEQPSPSPQTPTDEDVDEREAEAEAEAEAADLQPYEVAAHILVGPRGGKKLLNVLELKYDVSFVSAWPCFPSSHGQGHLLHRSYGYTCLRIEDLPGFHPDDDEERTLVVNTWSPAQRVLLYAWCAHRGRSAVVATRGRTCVACAVREAAALALGVVVVV